MQKTIAKVEYRDFVPSNCTSIYFCTVCFNGPHAEELRKQWRTIEYNRCTKYDFIYIQNQTQINNLRNAITFIYNNIANSKPLYRFWYNKAEKKLLNMAIQFSKQADELEKENIKISKKKLSIPEFKMCLEKFLHQTGFVLTHKSSSGKKPVKTTEIWTLEK